MLKIPTIIKKSLIYPNRYGCFVCIPIKNNSIILEKEKEFNSIEISGSQFKKLLQIIMNLPNEKQKKDLLEISDLFEFDKSNRLLPIANIAYLNSSDKDYNVQYINGILYSVRDINENEELISSAVKIKDSFP